MNSVIISVHNEEAIVKELVRRLKKVLNALSGSYEIIFIDNGSSDSTPRIIEEEHKNDSRIKFIQLSRDFGQGIALRAGFQFAKGDVVIIMDGDLQDIPEEIPKLISKLKEGYDLVYAQRINRQDSPFRKSASFIVRKILAYLIRGEDVPSGDERMSVGVFRAMNREVADAIKSLPEHIAYIQGLIRWVGFRQTTIEVEHGRRFAGKSKYALRNLLAYAFDGVISSSTYPLRFATLLGLLLAISSFLMGFGHFFYRIFYGTRAAGFTTLILVVLFLGGVQLMIIGIMGEYLGRIYTETKRKPLYIIKKKLL